MEGWYVVGAVMIKMWWLWLPCLLLIMVSETKLGKKVLDKLSSKML